MAERKPSSPAEPSNIPRPPLTNDVWIYLDTQNQHHAIQPVLDHMPTFVTLGSHAACNHTLSTLKTTLWSLPFLPCMLAFYLRQKGFRRRSTRRYFKRIWRTYGIYIEQTVLLKKFRPKLVVLLNDHVNRQRCMNLAAQQQGIPTVYIQHAPIRSGMAPLAFDHAILEGMDSVSKYERGNPSIHLYLAGMAKADAVSDQINTQSCVQRVGICSGWDPIDAHRNLIQGIQKQLPDMTLCFRPHPGDLERLEAWEDMSKELGIHYSDPLTDSAFKFLSEQDAVIAGDCGIHLEAALQNVVPIHFDILEGKEDFYGFVSSGLVYATTSADQLIDLLRRFDQSKPEVRSRAEPYSHGLGSELDGHRAERIAALLQALAKGGTNPQGWTPMETEQGPVYEPV